MKNVYIYLMDNVYMYIYLYLKIWYIYIDIYLIHMICSSLWRRCTWLLHWPSSSQGILTRLGGCCITMANKSPERETDLALRTCTRCRAVVSSNGCEAKQNHSNVWWSNPPPKKGRGHAVTAIKPVKIFELIPSPMWFGSLYTYSYIFFQLFLDLYMMCSIYKKPGGEGRIKTMCHIWGLLFISCCALYIYTVLLYIFLYIYMYIISMYLCIYIYSYWHFTVYICI